MSKLDSCMNCNRSSEEIPLFQLRYKNREHLICPQCLPILIHKPERISQVAGAWTAEKIEHEH